MPAYRGIAQRVGAKPVSRWFRPLIAADRVRLLKGHMPESKVPIDRHRLPAALRSTRHRTAITTVAISGITAPALACCRRSRPFWRTAESGQLACRCDPWPRLAHRADQCLSEVRSGGHGSSGVHHPQPGVPGQFPPQGTQGTGDRLAGVPHGWAVFWSHQLV